MTYSGEFKTRGPISPYPPELSPNLLLQKTDSS